MNYFYCIQCVDKISGKTGDFVYEENRPFEAISPIFDDLQGLFTWTRANNFEPNEYDSSPFVYVPYRLKKKSRKWIPCGLCHGSGKQKEYEEEWDCPPCNGTGGFWSE